MNGYSVVEYNKEESAKSKPRVDSLSSPSLLLGRLNFCIVESYKIKRNQEESCQSTSILIT